MKWYEFLFNVGLEGIGVALGIYLTVMFVDRRAERRERERWLTSQHLLHTNLLRTVNELLFATIPVEWSIVSSGGRYYFGEAAIFETWRFRTTSTAAAVEELKNADRDRIVEQDLGYVDLSDMDDLLEARRGIDDAIKVPAILLEPQLLGLLLHLHGALSEAIDRFRLFETLSSNESVSLEDRKEVESITLASLLSVILDAMEVKAWLEGRARYVSVEEELSALRTEVEDTIQALGVRVPLSYALQNVTTNALETIRNKVRDDETKHQLEQRVQEHGTEYERIGKLAETDPSRSVDETWAYLNQQILEMANRAKLDVNSETPAEQVAQTLETYINEKLRQEGKTMDFTALATVGKWRRKRLGTVDDQGPTVTTTTAHAFIRVAANVSIHLTLIEGVVLSAQTLEE